MNTRRWLLLLAAALLTTGCEDVTTGGGKEIEVYVVGNGGAQGTVQFDASVALLTDQGMEVPITTGTVSHSANMSGGEQTLLARRRVDAVEYTRARVTFTRVAADVTGGLVVGGVPLLGRLDVDIPAGGDVTLERAVEMTLVAQPRERLVIHLNTATWLPTVDRLTRRVPAASFRDAVDLRHE